MLAALVATSSLFAQTYDLGVLNVTTSASTLNQVPDGFQSPIGLTIENVGTVAIPAGTPISLIMTVNSTIFLADTLAFTTDIPAAGTSSLWSTANYTFDGLTPNVTICGIAYVVGFADDDSTNNTNCDNYTVTTAVSADLSATSITIIDPTNLDGFDLDNETETPPSLMEVNAIFTNNGDITYMAGYDISYDLYIGASSISLFGSLGSPLAPGQTTTRIISDPTLLPVVPEDSGTYELCVQLNDASDAVESNDTACLAFTIIDSYDPFNPSNWPLGVSNLNEDEISVFYANDFVVVEGITAQTNVRVMDVAGNEVMSEVLTSNGRLSLNAASGIYIVQAIQNGNLIKTQRVSVAR